MRRTTVVAIVLTGVGLPGMSATPAAAQTRVVVPIIVRVSPSPAPSSLLITTRTASPRPGVTTTRVTVRDTSGAVQGQSVSPTVRPLATVPVGAPSLQVTTRTISPRPGQTMTRVTVRDTTGAGRSVGFFPATGLIAAAPASTPSVPVTVDPPLEPDGTGDAVRTRATVVEDVWPSSRVLGSPVPVSLLPGAGPGQQTVLIMSEAPINAPIVILAP